MPGRRLDHKNDEAFASIGLSSQDVTRLRERFTAWPRAAEASGREERAGHAAGEATTEQQAAAQPRAAAAELARPEVDEPEPEAGA